MTIQIFRVGVALAETADLSVPVTMIRTSEAGAASDVSDRLCHERILCPEDAQTAAIFVAEAASDEVGIRKPLNTVLPADVKPENEEK